MERNGIEAIRKFCSQNFFISSLLYQYTPREGLGTVKLFMGVAGNDIKGGATCNNSKQ